MPMTNYTYHQLDLSKEHHPFLQHYLLMNHGGTHGFVVGHISPEAADGGLIALIKNGDTIIIDSEKNEINVKLDHQEIELRKKAWMKPGLKYKSGILYKYSKLVSSASKGCITD